jgi:hypothetical protein
MGVDFIFVNEFIYFVMHYYVLGDVSLHIIFVSPSHSTPSPNSPLFTIACKSLTIGVFIVIHKSNWAFMSS